MHIIPVCLYMPLHPNRAAALWLSLLAAGTVVAPVAAQSTGVPAVAAARPAGSVGSVVDTTIPVVTAAHHSAPLVRERDAIAAGAFAAATVLLIPVDESIAHGFQRPGVQSSSVLSGTATVFNSLGHPLSVFGIAGAAYLAGRVRHDDRLTDIGLHTGEAIVAAEVVDYVVKDLAGRSRPYVTSDTNATDFQLLRGLRKGEDYSSFPSGHVAASFAAATALAVEGARWWPHQTRYITPAAYTGATLVALSRLYADKHWASDATMAAGIGMLAARALVRHQHQHPRNLLDRLFLASSTTPVGRSVVLLGLSSRM